MLDSSDQSNGMAIQQAIVGLKQLDRGSDLIRLPVVGNSMSPMLKDRDILVISFAPQGRLACGDIIVWGKHELITHRVILARHHRVYTKGDARYWIDPVINNNDILGIVKQIDRNGLIADMESTRWKIINWLIGSIGWFQVCLVWRRQTIVKKRIDGSRMDRLSFWVSKKLNWVILFILAGRWMYQKSLRMDERC
jgi:signal peptidase I